MALVLGGIRWITASEPILYATSVTTKQLLSFESKAGELPYAKLMLQYPEAYLRDESLQVITISPPAYSAADEEAALKQANEQGDELLYWENELGWVEWTFDAPKGGWYELHFDYKALEGGNASVIRGVQLDGAYPFVESERIELERLWKDSKFPYDRNEIGQQIRPAQMELEEWIAKAAGSFSASSEPLLYRLEEGRHTLRLVGVRETVALREIAFKPREEVPDYENYKRLHPPVDSQPDWYSVIEAEQFKQKSSLAIQTDFWSEPHISPDPKGRITYNVLGGQRWRLPGEWVEWELNVPANGWYEIDLKTFQNYRNGFEAYRTISIDGKTPFQELLHYGIPTEKEFQLEALANDEGESFLFIWRREHIRCA